VPLLGTAWLASFSTYVVAMLLFNCPGRFWAPIVFGMPAATLLLGWAAVAGHRVPWVTGVQTLLIGAFIAAFYRQIRAKIELNRARAELARLAVSEERLRIARDLHDLLGQRLSAVSLKAELAARLVARDPDAAVAEMTSVAEVARAALEDVRRTVSGYRSVSLAGEVETARALLTAADVRLVTDLPADPLPEPIEECAAWVVREATTNVVRHAAARTCRIAARSQAVEVRNDGRTPVDVVAGSGLSGLAERVAAAGGTLWTGAEGEWFVVRASFA
jgi:two-component system, NarL family, sensor histidine kinase DesK